MPAEAEADALNALNFVQCFQIMPQPCVEGDAFRRLVRRGAREDVVGGQQHIAEADAHLPRTMTGRMDELHSI